MNSSKVFGAAAVFESLDSDQKEDFRVAVRLGLL